MQRGTVAWLAGIGAAATTVTAVVAALAALSTESIVAINLTFVGTIPAALWPAMLASILFIPVAGLTYRHASAALNSLHSGFSQVRHVKNARYWVFLVGAFLSYPFMAAVTIFCVYDSMQSLDQIIRRQLPDYYAAQQLDLVAQHLEAGELNRASILLEDPLLEYQGGIAAHRRLRIRYRKNLATRLSTYAYHQGSPRIRGELLAAAVLLDSEDEQRCDAIKEIAQQQSEVESELQMWIIDVSRCQQSPPPPGAHVVLGANLVNELSVAGLGCSEVRRALGLQGSKDPWSSFRRNYMFRNELLMDANCQIPDRG